MAYKEVVGLFQKQADEIYYVHIGDEVIEVTGEHPFWLEGKGWTFVKDLKVGDLLVSSDGTKLAIDKIEKESRQATVYNFEVEEFNSYFVSNLGIWVHNCAVRGVQPNDVVSYRPSGSPLENHHGVLDVWAKHNVPNYVSRGGDTPTIALTQLQHSATKAVYRDWLFEKTGKRVGGKVDWTSISPQDMKALSERMFDAAKVPQSSRQDYYSAFNQYNYRE